MLQSDRQVVVGSLDPHLGAEAWHFRTKFQEFHPESEEDAGASEESSFLERFFGVLSAITGKAAGI